MTRETKVGLLVGLAFIIIVGILLSEPLSHSNDAQPAQLPVVGPNVRAGVTTPGAGQQPPVTMIDQGNVAPRQTVPTQYEVSGRGNNGGVISIGPALRNPENLPHGRNDINITPPRNGGYNSNGGNNNGNVNPVYPDNRQSEFASGGNGGIRVEGSDQARGSIDIGTPLSNNGRPLRDPRDSGIPGDLAHDASRMGEELVPLNPRGSDRSGGNGSGGNGSGGANSNGGGRGGSAIPAGSRQYMVVAGDNLSKIATKVYGNNSKACRDAIIQANTSLQQDANKVVSGRTYIIPPMPGAAGPSSSLPAPGPASGGNPMPAPIRATIPTPPVSSGSSSAPGYVYTVKESDNLWKIAKEQLGDGGAVAAIKELNKEVLGGSDQVRPNMKLRLPAKPVSN